MLSVRGQIATVGKPKITNGSIYGVKVHFLLWFLLSTSFVGHVSNAHTVQCRSASRGSWPGTYTKIHSPNFETNTALRLCSESDDINEKGRPAPDEPSSSRSSKGTHGGVRSKKLKLKGATASKSSLDSKKKIQPRKTNEAKAKKTKRKSKTGQEPSHWANSSDDVQLEFDEMGDVSMVKFKVRGHPRPLVRHRTSRGFMYNPSAALQDSFRSVVNELIFQREETPTLFCPLFKEADILVMTIVFRMKRPKSHFVGSKPGSGRMKTSAPGQLFHTKTDVDNLSKFVLDSLNEFLYPDDSQITSLHVTKLLDNDDMCQGSTEIHLKKIGEKDLGLLLENSFRIAEK